MSGGGGVTGAGRPAILCAPELPPRVGHSWVVGGDGGDGGGGGGDGGGGGGDGGGNGGGGGGVNMQMHCLYDEHAP